MKKLFIDPTNFLIDKVIKQNDVYVPFKINDYVSEISQWLQSNFDQIYWLTPLQKKICKQRDKY